jgi:hypothetical protein
VSPLTPLQLEDLKRQRAVAVRSRAVGRHWYLRSVAMMVAAAIAGRRGGQVFVILAIILVILAAASISLGRSLRRNATATLEKIDLMEKT